MKLKKAMKKYNNTLIYGYKYIVYRDNNCRIRFYFIKHEGKPVVCVVI
jgi:hypothetical protein